MERKTPGLANLGTKGPSPALETWKKSKGFGELNKCWEEIPRDLDLPCCCPSRSHLS